MKLTTCEVDLHVHTVASGHAYSTLAEIAKEAAERGLRGFAMTDHGPKLPGGPHPYHFMALRFIPKIIHGVRVYRGIEANILGKETLDLSWEDLERLDVVMAGFHDGCGIEGEKSAHNYTRILLSVMENPILKVITHPGNPNYPIDHEAVVKAAARTNTALEINNASLSISRKGSKPFCLSIARLCAKYGAPVAVGSDAHIAYGVGVFEDALKVIAEQGIAPEQVVNRTLESTEKFFNLQP